MIDTGSRPLINALLSAPPKSLKIFVVTLQKVGEDDKCGNCGNLLKEVMLLKNEVEEIKFKRKDSNHEKTDQSGAFFDAIFNDVEAQHSCDIQKQP